ncbi:MAG: peptidoglycan-associated lipoprotein Pal [Desulfuromonadaceae bacterium]
MKKSMVMLLAGISMASLIAGGCANKEAVKKEEAVVPVSTAAKAEQAKPVEEVAPVEQVSEMKPAQSEVVSAPAADATPLASDRTVSEIMFENVYFDFDKSDLRQDSRDVLSKNADVILKSSSRIKVQISGHSDERGSAEYNLALGEHRAKSVRNYLITLGVNASDLSVISYGEEKPAVMGNDEAAWAKNRRAEFVIIK